MENISITLLASIVSAAIASGIITTIILWFLSKKVLKSKQANYAKELKRNKEIEFIIENIKQLNHHLQLESTPISNLLNSFKIDQEQITNFVLNQKAQKKQLSKKDMEKATKFKI